MQKRKPERRPPAPLHRSCIVFLKNRNGVRTAITGARRHMFGIAAALKAAGEQSVVIRL